MYASHLSYTNDARLGAPECDLLVDLVRRHEKAGLYGAKITGGGQGGTVAILADQSERAEGAIEHIIADYKAQTGHNAERFTGSSPGAWHAGTAAATEPCT
jgi:L-arabinokinase